METGRVESRRVPAEVGWAALSACLMYAAFPPLGLSWLAWIAPLGWLHLASRRCWHSSRPYWWLYAIGVGHWLLLVQWIRLPHWTAGFGWLALSAYLGSYVPAFVAAVRMLVHRFHVPLILAAPVAWTGLEYARGHLLTGFSISLLGHTQVDSPRILQISDLCGAYGVSFLVMFVAACLERMLPSDDRPRRLALPVSLAALVVTAVLFYGHVTMQRTSTIADYAGDAPLRVALVQGVLDTQFDGDVDRVRQAFFDYAQLSREAATRAADLDLMIWPESMFTSDAAMVSYEEPLAVVPGWDRSVDELRQRLKDYGAAVESRMVWLAGQTGTEMLVGTAWDHYRTGMSERFNSAVHLDRQGKVKGRYNKMHPVMFGEYVPLGDYFPWLYRLTPMRNGLARGTTPQAFDVGGVVFSPTICFENTVPHLVRRQVRQLSRAGRAPDVLVTISNDGWFWGSSLLDHHLACAVFRAIEMRRPLLVAANTGISAVIDANGQVLQRATRRQEAVLLVDLPRQADQRGSFYLEYGDWLGCFCVIALVAGWGVGGWQMRSERAGALRE